MDSAEDAYWMMDPSPHIYNNNNILITITINK
jgi:hypothetical protein